MNRASPICRLVAPSATSASTWRSRGVSPNGSAAPSARLVPRPGRRRRGLLAVTTSSRPRSIRAAQLTGQPVAPSRSATASASPAIARRCRGRGDQRVSATCRRPPPPGKGARSPPRLGRRSKRRSSPAPRPGQSAPPVGPAPVPPRPPSSPPRAAGRHGSGPGRSPRAPWRARADHDRAGPDRPRRRSRPLSPGDPHHVVGAQLKAVERLGDRRLGAVQVAAARRTARRAASLSADPLGPRNRQTNGSASSRLGRAPSRSPIARSARSAWADDQQHPDRRAGAQVSAGLLPFAGLEGHLGHPEVHPVMGVDQPPRGLRQPLARGLERRARLPDHVVHVGQIRVGADHAVQVVVAAGDLDRSFEVVQTGLGVPERDARHPERVEDLGLGQRVADRGRFLQGGLGVVGGLPEAAAQEARPGQPALQHGAQVIGIVLGQQLERAFAQRHRFRAAVQAPDGPGQSRQQVGVARGIGVRVELAQRDLQQVLAARTVALHPVGGRSAS